MTEINNRRAGDVGAFMTVGDGSVVGSCSVKDVAVLLAGDNDGRRMLITVGSVFAGFTKFIATVNGPGSMFRGNGCKAFGIECASGVVVVR